MFTSVLFKGALVFVSQDFIHVGSTYPAFSAKDATVYMQRYDAVLPTPQLVDAIYIASTCKIYTPPSNPRSSTSAPLHDRIIRKQKAACSDLSLIDGHKKTIVQSHLKHKMALYGWFNKNGTAIQPYNTSHSLDYKDYSQGIRLVYKWAIHDGRIVPVEQVLFSH